MRTRKLLVSAAVVLVALGVACCASAPPPLVASEIPAPHFECKRENSIPLNLDVFAGRLETYAGYCVHARGFKIAGFFYPDLVSFYSGWGTPSSYKVIRVFDESGNARSDFSFARDTIELTALAYSCAEWNRRYDDELEQKNRRLSQQGSPVRLIASGQPCPPFNDRDAILFVSEWRPVSGMPRRLVGQDAARRYGTLLEVTDDWQYAGQVKRIANEWFDAVRRQDVEKFMDATGEREQVVEVLSSERSRLRFLFGMPAVPPIEFFRTRPNPPTDDPNVVYAHEFAAYGCVCKVGDCMDQWPIVSDDALFDEEWPYVCLEIVRDDEGHTYIPAGMLDQLIR